MSEQPFFIFLPVRNGGRYVGQAVQSIVDQTDPDWRLIVLENASTDDTIATIEGFRDDRISVVASSSALPIDQNWHRIVEQVSGLAGDALMTFIGHDDLLFPNFVADVRVLAASMPDATIYQTLFYLIDADGDLIRPCRPIPAIENPFDMLAAMGWGLRDAYGTGYAFRIADYIRVGGIPPLPRIFYADHLLFMRLAQLGSKCCGDRVACAYRLHSQSMTNSVSGDKINDQVEAFAQLVDLLRTEFPETFETDKGRDALARWIDRELMAFTGSIVRRFLSGSSEDRVRHLQRIRAELPQKLGSWDRRPQHRVARTLRRAQLQVAYALAALRSR